MHVVNNFAMLYAVTLDKHLMTLVIISTVVQWVLGAVWYGLIFKKSWMKFVGFAEGEKPKYRVFGMVSSLIACFLLSFVLAHLVGWAGSVTFTGGAKIGIISWLGFMAPPLFVQHIFENRRANLFAINASYWLLCMAAGGGIMGAFHS
jgi:Protein of unknown function (DUF1761)